MSDQVGSIIDTPTSLCICHGHKIYQSVKGVYAK
jgi:hypothetical protein